MYRKFKYLLRKSSSSQRSKSASLFEIFFLNLHSGLVACQAEKELQPWIAKDDNLGQKKWRINQRIVKLIIELMRNHDSLESLVVVASASDLLLRATDGMLVDGEACTLPQLKVSCSYISLSMQFQNLMSFKPVFNSWPNGSKSSFKIKGGNVSSKIFFLRVI